MQLTKENLKEIYNDPELNIYCNGEIVDGFSEEDIINAIDNGATVEYYKSTRSTVNEVIEDQITSFIKEHWEPKFYLNKLPTGANVAELSLLGETSMSDLVNGILFNLSVICKILPKETSEWYKRTSENILTVIHFNVTPEELAKLEDTSKRLEKMNTELARHIENYDRKNKKMPTYLKFSRMLIEHAPINQAGKVLRDMITSVFHPNVFYVESERKWATGYTIGNIISEMVYILGISHEEAVKRYASAVNTLNDMLQYDADKEYFRLMLKTGRGPQTEKNLANEFAIHITKYLAERTGGKYDKNPLIEAFISELRTPSTDKK